MKNIYLINGPNLNRLGDRSKSHYGGTTLTDIVEKVKGMGANGGFTVCDFQSNHEGAIIDIIHSILDDDKAVGLIMNPGAFTHYSIAIRDALEMLKLRELPVIEVHLSNIHAREEFRHRTVTGGVSTAIISGLKEDGYYLAMDYLMKKSF